MGVKAGRWAARFASRRVKSERRRQLAQTRDGETRGAGEGGGRKASNARRTPRRHPKMAVIEAAHDDRPDSVLPTQRIRRVRRNLDFPMPVVAASMVTTGRYGARARRCAAMITTGDAPRRQILLVSKVPVCRHRRRSLRVQRRQRSPLAAWHPGSNVVRHCDAPASAEWGPVCPGREDQHQGSLGAVRLRAAELVGLDLLAVQPRIPAQDIVQARAGLSSRRWLRRASSARSTQAPFTLRGRAHRRTLGPIGTGMVRSLSSQDTALPAWPCTPPPARWGPRSPARSAGHTRFRLHKHLGNSRSFGGLKQAEWSPIARVPVPLAADLKALRAPLPPRWRPHHHSPPKNAAPSPSTVGTTSARSR